MNKVIIYAYTKMNLGDDLFIKILCERYGNTKFFLYAPKIYKEIFKNTKNLICYSSENILYRSINFIGRKFKVHNFIEQCLSEKAKIAVNIGGSLFIQGQNWEQYFKYIKSLKRKGQPFYLLGVNFGPFKDDKYYKKHKELFKEYEDICFREKYSYKLFKDLPNTRIAPDIVFNIKNKNVKEENKAIISVIKPSYRKNLKGFDEVYYNKLKDICYKFMDEGIKVILMSFCKLEGDEEGIENIVNKFPKEYKEKVKIYKYNTNIDEAIEVIKSSKFIIASRFHAMILGFALKKKVFPIIYSNKMKNVLEDINFNNEYVFIKNMELLNTSLLLNNLKYNYVNVKKINNKEKHFEKLDLELNNKLKIYESRIEEYE
ncbi:polysaccharide pyruvyl transferase family protein [Clostridium tarantellae]|uniref:Polysaccharide pyruvyl transferase domain-containing protein n=1 Tax=Clostridium tarantellae TaxID=39493 RepID=A0A6I1ML06_9CLOT|nr:polysaccharide pyruvyl transferase family protein [Clostridium tarantellae]MPQ43654.1 hypothetical protein [Clostridium tarantellae]